MHRDIATLPGLLSRAGYATRAVGKLQRQPIMGSTKTRGVKNTTRTEGQPNFSVLPAGAVGANAAWTSRCSAGATRCRARRGRRSGGFRRGAAGWAGHSNRIDANVSCALAYRAGR